jgi:phosphopantetheine--protein transferase-like protein
MKLTVGTDIIEIERIRQTVEQKGKRFLERIYTPAELDYAYRSANPHIHLAGLWAAKEAIFKALDADSPEALKSIEILHDISGKPFAHFHIHAEIELSISHSKNYAIAVAIVMF